MIKTYKNMWVSKFGNGTIRINSSVDFGIGSIDLNTCDKQNIGSEAGKFKEFPKMRLNFEDIESIDVLISKLQDTKELMLEAKAKGQK